MEKEYFFPAMYFKTGFTSPNVFVATQTLLEGSENPEVKQGKQHNTTVNVPESPK